MLKKALILFGNRKTFVDTSAPEEHSTMAKSIDLLFTTAALLRQFLE